jgi:hypothetical protein
VIPEASCEILRHAFEDLSMRTVWCAYYDGNEKSKRAQEKIGFVFHHTSYEVDVPLLNEKRTGHVNCMTKAQWLNRGNIMKFGWINLFSACIVVLMLIPNIIYALSHKDEKNLCTNKLMNVLEQGGRYGCIILCGFRFSCGNSALPISLKC